MNSVVKKIFLLLLAYALLLVFYTGFKPFTGDSWQVLSLSYNKSFINAIKTIPYDFRIAEAFFYILELKLIGLNGFLAHLISLLLHITQVILFGQVIKNWSKNNKLLIALSMLFAFFYPAVSFLTYNVFNDNSRLAGIFFWSSILFFQKAFNKYKSNVVYLIYAGFLYILSFLSYENFSFLIFTAPVFIQDLQSLKISQFKKRKKLYIFLFAYLLLLLIINVIVRKFFLDGGAVKFKKINIFFFLKSVIKYYFVSLKDFYYSVLKLKSNILTNRFLIIPLFLFFGLLQTLLLRIKNKKVDKILFLKILTTGAAMTLLGIIPYIIAGYRPSARTQTSFAYGLALLTASIVLFFQETKYKKIVLIIYVFFITAFGFNHFVYAKNWKLTAHFQKKIFTSLLESCPNVKNNTALLLAYKSMPEGIGVESLKVLPKIIYSSPSSSAYFIYPSKAKLSAEYYARVSKNGVRPRGLPNAAKPIPLDKIVILEYENEIFKLRKNITQDDNKFLIEWQDDIIEIKTNSSLIQSSKLENQFINNYLRKLPD